MCGQHAAHAAVHGAEVAVRCHAAVHRRWRAAATHGARHRHGPPRPRLPVGSQPPRTQGGVRWPAAGGT